MEVDQRATGGGLAYADPQYAASLREFGSPLELPSSRGWVLQRAIPGTTSCDSMGCYPLFSCRDWSTLTNDLEDLPGNLVSLTLVTDPFAAPSADELRDTFDVVLPFKHHFLIDLDRPAETVVARHHRKSVRKALRALTIEQYDPTTELSTWCELYGHLIEKHRIDGIRAFSSASFAAQADLNGLVGLKASLGDRVVGMHWYLTASDVVYAHLAALHPDAYGVYASHGLFWTAIEMFTGNYRWLDMGAGTGAAGTGGDGDGLTEFKAGWSSDTAPTFLCGKILDRARYDELTRRDLRQTEYFPAYRYGEFSPAPARSAG
jgi:hypothetical protein